MNNKMIKIIGLVASIAGFGAQLLTAWVDEKKMNEVIEKKVNEALDARDRQKEEES